MYVWFYVLNHSKYRFSFNAVYIGIMNRIRKPTFHAAIYNRVKCFGSDVRSRPLQSAPTACFGARTVVKLHREQTRPRKPYRGILRTSVRNSPVRIFPIVRWERGVPLSDKLRFVRQRSSLCEAGAAPKSRPFFKLYMDTNRKQTDKTDKKPRTPSYKYSFLLNEEQNIRFNELLCKAGSEHNRSRFIVKRIFAEEFVVIRRDPSKVQFVARLNDFYFQFQKLANNYNQVVKAINSHFSNIAIPHQIAALEQRTRELKALSIEILNLAKQAAERLRI